MLSLHEAHAFVIDEEGALAAHRLRDQRLLPPGVGPEPQHGRVELHELEVAQPRTGAQGQGDTVAGRDRRVGGRREDLAQATARQHDGAAPGDADAVLHTLAEHVDGHAGDTVVSGHQVERERMLDHVDLRSLVDGGGKRALDLGAGRVTACVHDPVAMMPALTGELELAERCRVEGRSERDQLAQCSGALGDERADSILVAQPGAGRQRVVEVVLGAVPRTDRGGHAAHRPARRAGRQHVLRHDQHPAELAGP